jgi:hypothetical protein
MRESVFFFWGLEMLKLTSAAAAGLAAAGLVLAVTPTVAASQAAAVPAARFHCVNKAGLGSSITTEGAKFQAYTAVLQAVDWNMWASWMLTSQKFGEAPGYDVSKVNFNCTPNTGFGATCQVRATLCKKG